MSQPSYHYSPSTDYLPAYDETMQGRKSVTILEKDLSPENQKSGSKMSSLKKMFRTDNHTTSRASSISSSSTTSSSSSKSSTLKSILTGDVHKHHPMFRLEDAMDQQMRRQPAQTPWGSYR